MMADMVTCDGCAVRETELRGNGQRASEVYEVGNPARNQMGHSMYFAADGRTALCVAKIRPEARFRPEPR